MPQGIIARLTEDGYGFIERTAREDTFFHRAALKNATFDELHPGDRVEFDLEAGTLGRADRATRVRRLGAPRR